MADNRIRPSSYETLEDVEARLTRKQLMKTTWIPRGGSGKGLKNGRRVYYRNGKIVPASAAVIKDLLIENPTELAKGTLDNALYAGKQLYNLTRDTSNAVLGPILSPWQIANQVKFAQAVREEKEDYEKSKQLPPPKIVGQDYFDPDYTKKKELKKQEGDDALTEARSQLLINKNKELYEEDYIYPEGEQVFEPKDSVIEKPVVKKQIPKVFKPQPWKNEGGYTPNAAELRRATGININDAKGKKAWERLIRSNQVFDTTKEFGDDGGFFVQDNRGIPRFVKYQGG